MKPSSLLALLLFLMTSLGWAQGASSGQNPSRTAQTQPSAPGAPASQRTHTQMQAICKENIDAMKTDVQKMRSAFDKMKANVASISDPNEKTRWQANVDMWQIVLDRRDQM